MARRTKAVDGDEGHDLLGEDGAPLSERLVGGDEQGPVLIVGADEFEHRTGLGLVLADEAGNRDMFCLPSDSQGDAALSQMRVTTMLEVGTRAIFVWYKSPLSESEVEEKFADGSWESVTRGSCRDRRKRGCPVGAFHHLPTGTGGRLLFATSPARTDGNPLRRKEFGQIQGVVLMATLGMGSTFSNTNARCCNGVATESNVNGWFGCPVITTSSGSA